MALMASQSDKNTAAHNLIDLAEQQKLFGEVVMTFKEGKAVGFKKVETYRPEDLGGRAA